MPTYEAKDLELEDKDEWMFRIPGGTTMKQATAMKQTEEKQVTAELRGPESIGDFEHLGEAAATHLVQPLLLGDGATHHGGARLQAYQAGYNAYTGPMRTTLGAMGRVKDLQTAGGMLTPEELQADKQVAHKFRRLSVSAKADADEHEQHVFTTWQGAQTTMHKDFSEVVAARKMLDGVLARFQRAQNMLHQRALESEKAALVEVKARIEQAAETLARIVHVSIETWEAVGHADKLAGLAIQQGKQESAFSLEEVFVWAMGDSAKYDRLKKDIDRLDGQLQSLDMKNEDLEIEAALKDLVAFQFNLDIKEQAVRADQKMARGGAHAFAKAMDGGDKGLLAMYAAEAYQELALSANEAHAARASAVDPSWAWVRSYAGHYKLTYEAQHWQPDWHKLVDNVYGVQGQRKLVESHLGEWTGRAEAWRQFLRQITSKSLDAVEP